MLPSNTRRLRCMMHSLQSAPCVVAYHQAAYVVSAGRTRALPGSRNGDRGGLSRRGLSGQSLVSRQTHTCKSLTRVTALPSMQTIVTAVWCNEWMEQQQKSHKSSYLAIRIRCCHETPVCCQG